MDFMQVYMLALHFISLQVKTSFELFFPFFLYKTYFELYASLTHTFGIFYILLVKKSVSSFSFNVDLLYLHLYAIYNILNWLFLCCICLSWICTIIKSI